MVSFFSCKIAKLLTRKRNVSEEEFEVYVYVIEYFFENFLFFTIMTATGILCKKTKEMCTFYILFIPLRKMAGGVHANTSESCLFFSVIIYIANIFGTGLTNHIPFLYGLIFSILLSIGIIILSPVDSINLSLSEATKRRNKVVTAVILLFVELIAILILKKWNISIMQSMIVCDISVLLLQLIGMVKNKKEGGNIYEDKRQEVSGENE